jgi:hypothetical protein
MSCAAGHGKRVNARKGLRRAVAAAAVMVVTGRRAADVPESEPFRVFRRRMCQHCNAKALGPPPLAQLMYSGQLCRDATHSGAGAGPNRSESLAAPALARPHSPPTLRRPRRPALIAGRRHVSPPGPSIRALHPTHSCPRLPPSPNQAPPPPQRAPGSPLRQGRPPPRRSSATEGRRAGGGQVRHGCWRTRRSGGGGRRRAGSRSRCAPPARCRHARPDTPTQTHPHTHSPTN